MDSTRFSFLVFKILFYLSSYISMRDKNTRIVLKIRYLLSEGHVVQTAETIMFNCSRKDNASCHINLIVHLKGESISSF